MDWKCMCVLRSCVVVVTRVVCEGRAKACTYTSRDPGGMCVGGLRSSGLTTLVCERAVPMYYVLKLMSVRATIQAKPVPHEGSLYVRKR